MNFSDTELNIQADILSAAIRRQLGSAAPAQRALPGNAERRYSGLQVRADQSGGKRRVRGYAAVFNSQSCDLGGFREVLKPGCFSRSLRVKPDVAMLASHDTTRVLARTSNNSLRVKEDDTGLLIEAELIDTQLGEDVYKEIAAGLQNEMSFMFTIEPDGDEWDEYGTDDRGRCLIRSIRDCTLYEVSCCWRGAYSATSIGARSLWPDGVPSEIRSRIGGVDPELQALRARAQRAVRSL